MGVGQILWPTYGLPGGMYSAAAQLLDMPRWEFVRHASRLGIAFVDLTEDEWAAERIQAETL